MWLSLCCLWLIIPSQPKPDVGVFKTKLLNVFFFLFMRERMNALRGISLPGGAQRSLWAVILIILGDLLLEYYFFQLTIHLTTRTSLLHCGALFHTG